eukprot:gene3454-6875_t
MEQLGIPYRRLAIVGAEKSGKTSLAFAFATEAANKNKNVLFVCNKNKIESNFPHVLHMESIRGLSNIRMQYVSCVQDLKVLCMSISVSYGVLPTVIVIEDLSRIIDPLRAVQRNDLLFLETALSIVSYVNDIRRYIEETSQAQVQLIITDECSDNNYHGLIMRVVEASLTLQNHTQDRVTVSLQSPSKDHSTRDSDGPFDITWPRLLYGHRNDTRQADHEASLPVRQLKTRGLVKKQSSRKTRRRPVIRPAANPCVNVPTVGYFESD